jgi:hypothetical protein
LEQSFLEKDRIFEDIDQFRRREKESKKRKWREFFGYLPFCNLINVVIPSQGGERERKISGVKTSFDSRESLEQSLYQWRSGIVIWKIRNGLSAKHLAR